MVDALPTNTPTPASAPLLQRGAAATLAEQLAAHYGQRIRSGSIGAGARLPSVREAARRHSLAASTVVAAYDLLQAQGLAEARQQRGFFVRSEPMAAALMPAAPRAAPPHDIATLMRGMFAHQAGRLAAPGGGTLPADWLDLPLLHGAMRRAMADDARDPASLRYGEPAGDGRLRAALAIRLAGLGISATAEQIVTTAGATQALDIVARLLLAPGDTVLVDDPGWAVEFAHLRQLGMKLAPVPRGPQGPDLQVMRRLLEAGKGPSRPRAYFTVSVLHNPTGQTLPLAAAHELLKLAESHQLTIVEDDTYAWLAPPQAPRLAALDQLQRTVYISGFSKIVAPNWRVGYLAASPTLVEAAIDRKLLGALTTPSLPERALAIMLEQGSLRRHAERMVARLDAARQRAVRLAHEAGFAFASPPQGLFGWLDTGVDSERLAALLYEQGWLLAPGSLFHAAPSACSLMRMNFANSQEARLWRALRSACDSLRPPTNAGAAFPATGRYHSGEPGSNKVRAR